ncbi:uncharacterized protein LOC113218470 [Frankliniella occidentalis]|uniref:Gustatory receptor n=1 Tax=Frankliniella occidentalis TaxID=133901 RepID=A0A9C6XCD1_FRAOC|nr:uncharacterized protein LOC113218470 [Frankliniella occidentalis]
MRHGPAQAVPILLRRSCALLCYSVALVSAVLGYTIYSAVEEFLAVTQNNEVRWTKRTDAYVSLCEYTTLWAATGVAAASSWLRRDADIRHADLLSEVDVMLGLPPPRPQLWLAAWVAAMLSVLVADKIVWFMTEQDNYLEDMPLYVTYFTCFVSETLYMSDAQAIQTRLAAINQVLEEASPRPGHRDAHGSPVVLPGTLTVSRLATAHSLLAKATQTVSRRYGLALLTDMVALLINLVITCYLFLEHMLPLSEPPEDYTRFFMEIVFACLHFSRIVMLVEQPSAATYEADRTGALMGYLGSTVPYGSMMHEQLKALSVQLRHQQTSFTNCGLFDMNRTVIVSIVGAVATYLLVLLQLKSPSSTKGQPSNST